MKKKHRRQLRKIGDKAKRLARKANGSNNGYTTCLISKQDIREGEGVTEFFGGLADPDKDLR